MLKFSLYKVEVSVLLGWKTRGALKPMSELQLVKHKREEGGRRGKGEGEMLLLEQL